MRRMTVLIVLIVLCVVWGSPEQRCAAHLVDFVDIGIHSIVPPGEKLWIGVTLHPYYSYVTNIVGDVARVFPITDVDFDPHNPKSEPDIIDNIKSMHIVVINGIGHDEYAIEIIQYGALKDVPIYVIPVNKGVSLIPGTSQDLGGNPVNSHTFLSITATLQQIRNIQDALIKTDPAHAPEFRKNARDYAMKLRKMKADYIERLAALPDIDIRCAATSEAYTYLLQEFGLEVAAVIEPVHGQKVNAKDVKAAINMLRDKEIEVLFTDSTFPEKYLKQLEKSSDVAIYQFSHILSGAFRKEHYEEEMRYNLETLTNAIIDAQKRRSQK